MNRDQASQLRKRMQNLQHQLQQQEHFCPIIGIISGKGGVGKSVFSTNLSIALAQRNKKVLIIDLDVGMGNIEQLIGQTSLYHIDDCIRDHLPLTEAMYKGPGSLTYIPGGTGFEEILEISEQNLLYFLNQIESIKKSFDYVFFDFGAGVSAQMLPFMRAVNQLILVTTPEPPAMADGYSALKLICSDESSHDVFCVINQVSSFSEARETWQRLASTARRFIGIDPKWLAALHHDSAVVDSVKQQNPCLLRFPRAKFSADVHSLAANFLDNGQITAPKEVHSIFYNRVLHYLKFTRR